jgi:hypothetical protein
MTDWTRPFDEPIALPDGSLLRTLLDAGRYVAKLPKARYERPEWQKAAALLLSAAEARTPVMFANAALMRAVENDT